MLVFSIAFFAFVEAGFRGRLVNLVSSANIGLAVVATLVLVYEFFWQLVVAAVLVVGLYVLWDNLRELREMMQSSSRGDTGGTPVRMGAMARTIRVVVAKVGLDGHDRGAKIIARALRDAGMEVIYTGLHQTPEQVVEAAIQEDADAIGISILSGAHMTLVPRIIELLEENEAEDILVFVGGTIPKEDITQLKELGVGEVFTPGTPTKKAVEYVEQAVRIGSVAASGFRIRQAFRQLIA